MEELKGELEPELYADTEAHVRMAETFEEKVGRAGAVHKSMMAKIREAERERGENEKTMNEALAKVAQAHLEVQRATKKAEDRKQEVQREKMRNAEEETVCQRKRDEVAEYH